MTCGAGEVSKRMSAGTACRIVAGRAQAIADALERLLLGRRRFLQSACVQFVALACIGRLRRYRFGRVQAAPGVTKPIGERNLARADIVAETAVDAVAHAEFRQ